jgi:hypothetical protein
MTYDRTSWRNTYIIYVDTKLRDNIYISHSYGALYSNNLLHEPIQFKQNKTLSTIRYQNTHIHSSLSQHPLSDIYIISDLEARLAFQDDHCSCPENDSNGTKDNPIIICLQLVNSIRLKQPCTCLTITFSKFVVRHESSGIHQRA